MPDEKKITNLDIQLMTADEKPMRMASGDAMSVRTAILLLLNNHRCEPPGIFKVYELAVRIRAANGVLELSEADHIFLKDIVEKSWQSAPFGAYALSQIYRTVTG